MHLPSRWIFVVTLALLFAVAGYGTLPLSASPSQQAQPAALNRHIFLPLSLKLGGPQGAPGGVVNGGFESGATAWTVSSTFGRTVIRRTFVGSVAPHTGSYAAWLGGLRSETTAIQQQVHISAAAPYLAYWHWIGSNDFCGYDLATIRINGAIAHSYNLCADTATGGWAKHVVNLSAYANQTVTLQIRAITDSSLNSNLFIDDIGFQSAQVMQGEAPTVELSAEPAPATALKPSEPLSAQEPADAIMDTLESNGAAPAAPADGLKPNAPVIQEPMEDALTDAGGE